MLNSEVNGALTSSISVGSTFVESKRSLSGVSTSSHSIGAGKQRRTQEPGAVRGLIVSKRTRRAGNARLHQSEIDQLRKRRPFGRSQHDIGGLEIPVDEPGCVRALERPGYLLGNLDRLS